MNHMIDGWGNLAPNEEYDEPDPYDDPCFIDSKYDDPDDSLFDDLEDEQ